MTIPEITLTVSHEVGLHVRPAALFVQTAKQFNGDIRVTYGEKEANAKSILSALALGAEQGAVITIRAGDEDGDQALEALVMNNFGDRE